MERACDDFNLLQVNISPVLGLRKKAQREDSTIAVIRVVEKGIIVTQSEKC
jgi:hypothetical protein